MKTGARRATRERILEVAESYLGERGYHGTRLHEIARRVGVQKASLFHYFPSKEELYRAVVEEGFGETEQVIDAVLERGADPRETMRALVESYVDLVAVHPARTRILLRQSLGDAPAGGLPSGSERLLERIVAFIAEGQRAGVFAPVDPLALVLGVAGMVAFFFTSAPVVAPAWAGDPTSPGAVERVKRHVVEMVRRCLAVGAELRPGAWEYAAL